MRFKIVTRQRFLIFLFVLNASLSFPLLAFADRVLLKNGDILECEVLDKNVTDLEIKLKNGDEVWMKLDEVESIEKKPLPPDFFQEEQPPAEKPSSEKPKEPFYKITNIVARYIKEDRDRIIEVKGAANLPDNSLIYIFLKRLDNCVVSGEALAKDNNFSIRLGPIEKELLPGKYVIEADFIPYRQTEEIQSAVAQAEGVSEAKLIHVSYPFTLDRPDNPEETSLTERQFKADLLSMISKLQKLYDELNNIYRVRVADHDKWVWEKWSNDWISKVKDIDVQNREKSQRYVSLYPKAQENIHMVTLNLQALQNAYSLEVLTPDIAAKVAKDPNARGGPGVLKKIIQNLIKAALKELGSS